MNIIIDKIQFFFSRYSNPLLTSIYKETEYINSFAEPNNNIERSYFQYKCQMYIFGKPLAFLLNILSLPLIFLLLIFGMAKKASYLGKYDCSLLINGNPIKIVPNDLLKKYKSTYEFKSLEIVIGFEDLKFIIKNCKPFCLSFYFILKSLIKIGMYRYAINSTKANVIITSCEYSFTSSLLTEWCHSNGVKHINIMHGEKLYDIKDSFCSFDEFYIWDEYYMKLFDKLRFKTNYFIVSPKHLLLDAYLKNDKKYDYKYYLQDNSKDELFIINELLCKIKKDGKTVCLRPHPIYSNIKQIEMFFGDIEIEDTKSISIEQSLCETKNVIGLHSTVMFQAYKNNINTIIDDVSNKQKYNNLLMANYILFSKNYYLLSDIINTTI